MTNEELMGLKLCNNGRVQFGYQVVQQRVQGLTPLPPQIQSFVIGEQRHHELEVLNPREGNLEIGLDPGPAYMLFCKFCGIARTGYDWEQILTALPQNTNTGRQN